MARRGEDGFTLLELITVIALIGILVTMAIPNYRVSIQTAKEAVLKTDLATMRDAIDQYYADKGKYPASIDTLAEDGYLRKPLAADPITGQADWEGVPAEADPDNPNQEAGIWNVTSASPLTGLNGIPYNEW